MGGVKILFGFAEKMPLDDNSQDIIIATEIMEHFIDVDIALTEFNRIMRVKGELFMQTPLENLIESTNHVRLFSAESLKNLVQKYFTVQDIKIIPYLYGDGNNSIFCIAKKK